VRKGGRERMLRGMYDKEITL